MLTLSHIHKYYGQKTAKVKALKDISLQIERGDFISIMGTSGSGKSTLINILGLLDKNFEGDYHLVGKDISSLDDDAIALIRGEEIGFVFQDFNLLDEYTVLENITLPFLYRDQKPDMAVISDLLEKFNLSTKASAFPKELSGGQKQRVAIIRALAVQPSLLIADEPTGALDSQTRDEILQVFDDLNRDGVTICLVTHDPQVAQHANRHFTLQDGRLTEMEEAHV